MCYILNNNIPFEVLTVTLLRLRSYLWWAFGTQYAKTFQQSHKLRYDTVFAINTTAIQLPCPSFFLPCTHVHHTVHATTSMVLAFEKRLPLAPTIVIK